MIRSDILDDLDYYRVLGVPRWANVEQIKAAYRRRALRHHPDKNDGCRDAEDRFKRCTEAYHALTDRERRAAYDTRLWTERSPRQLVTGLFEELLAGRLKLKQTGRDLHHALAITLEQSAAGGQHRLSFVVEEPCAECHETGAAEGGSRRCEDCGGRGELPRDGLLALPRLCPGCGGRGKRTVTSCRTCDGVGTREVTREVVVKLRPGVHDGHEVTFARCGDPGRHGGEPGDLRVVVRVASHPLFERWSSDLAFSLPIDIVAAALGGTLEVPTLDGAVRMKVPAGTQSGDVLRVRGKGMPRGAGHGDLLITVQVETPVALDPHAQTLLRQLADACGEACYPVRREFAETVARLHRSLSPGSSGDA
jgi:molecular chaperone DnaJ